jgi:hypothetical protein
MRSTFIKNRCTPWGQWRTKMYITRYTLFLKQWYILLSITFKYNLIWFKYCNLIGWSAWRKCWLYSITWVGIVTSPTYSFANDKFKKSHEIIVIKIEESLNFAGQNGHSLPHGIYIKLHLLQKNVTIWRALHLNNNNVLECCHIYCFVYYEEYIY